MNSENCEVIVLEMNETALGIVLPARFVHFHASYSYGRALSGSTCAALRNRQPALWRRAPRSMRIGLRGEAYAVIERSLLANQKRPLVPLPATWIRNGSAGRTQTRSTLPYRFRTIVHFVEDCARLVFYTVY